MATADVLRTGRERWFPGPPPSKLIRSRCPLPISKNSILNSGGLSSMASGRMTQRLARRSSSLLARGPARPTPWRTGWPLSPPLDQHIDRLIESAKRNLPAAGEGEEAQRPVQLSQEPRQQKQPPERKPFRPNPALAAVVFAAVILAVALALTLAGKFRIRTTPPDQQTATKVEAPAQPAPVPPPGPNPKSRAAPARATSHAVRRTVHL